MLIPFLLSCSTTAPTASEVCVESVVSDDASSVSEEVVLVAVEGYAPTSISWSVAADGATSSALDISLTRGGGESEVVERSGGQPSTCREGVFRRVPLRFDVVVDGGSVTATLDGAVDAYEASLASIYAYGIDGHEGSASLSEEWEAAAHASDEVSGDIGQWWVGLSGALDSLQMDVGGSWEGPNDSGEGSFWRGVVSVD